jgi:hypothetical protein
LFIYFLPSLALTFSLSFSLLPFPRLPVYFGWIIFVFSRKFVHVVVYAFVLLAGTYLQIKKSSLIHHATERELLAVFVAAVRTISVASGAFWERRK